MVPPKVVPHLRRGQPFVESFETVTILFSECVTRWQNEVAFMCGTLLHRSAALFSGWDAEMCLNELPCG